MKRTLTIQDLSCVGKCSLSVAMPIISAMGVETCVLPSAVLSTHTGGFSGYVFKDLTDTIIPISEHWKKENIYFDGIYTGYIGSIEQLEYIKQIIKDFKKNETLILIDPVMADNGLLYKHFDLTFPMHMASLVSYADIITPNITEACLLTNNDYKDNMSKNEIEDILHEFADMGPKIIVLTGVSFKQNQIGVAIYDVENKITQYYFNNRIENNFHGTGDIFASVLFGALMRGYSIKKAVKLAADFVADSIKKTLDMPIERWYGVAFEKALPNLIRKING